MAPTPADTDTRQRIVTATIELFRRQGYNGTSLSQIVKASGATTGSLYHFFPGGKVELTAEALRSAGAAYGELVDLIISAAIDPATAMTDAFEGAASVLTDTDFIDPCPIGTIAREVASTHEPLRQVAESVIEAWVQTVRERFVEGGINPERADGLARMAIASIEGGFMMARTNRDVAPFLAIGRSLRAAVEHELRQGAPG